MSTQKQSRQQEGSQLQAAAFEIPDPPRNRKYLRPEVRFGVLGFRIGLRLEPCHSKLPRRLPHAWTALWTCRVDPKTECSETSVTTKGGLGFAGH